MNFGDGSVCMSLNGFALSESFKFSLILKLTNKFEGRSEAKDPNCVMKLGNLTGVSERSEAENPNLVAKRTNLTGVSEA